MHDDKRIERRRAEITLQIEGRRESREHGDRDRNRHAGVESTVAVRAVGADRTHAHAILQDDCVTRGETAPESASRHRPKAQAFGYAKRVASVPATELGASVYGAADAVGADLRSIGRVEDDGRAADEVVIGHV